MTQLHTIHRGIGIVRPTNDVDIVLHIEARRGLPALAARELETLGYRLLPSIDPRNNTAHRFVRSSNTVDLVTSTADEQVDMLIADHAAPRVIETLRGRTMVQIDGGTQALRRTINAEITLGSGGDVTISVPRAFGALILKAAAYRTDSRDRDRHLFDAAALLACIDDPVEEGEALRGSDRGRIATLQHALQRDHPAWRQLPSRVRGDAEAALRILAAH
ncbi:hypothetical protein [Metallococcus carri]|nr:hypothetical protein [Metallococcus carri]